MKNFHYFLKVFAVISIGLTAGLLTYGFLMLEEYTAEPMGRMVLISVCTGITTGFILGLAALIFKPQFSRK
ncbi:MAG: hypothetical protein EOO45_12685 [Flavobacterium sp.]|nr:MAG: hypothetical protein EOO45_12685 [Flavobacterium sp.]